MHSLTYRFGRGWDVLDHHLAFGAQVLFSQRRFAILIQVHVLLHNKKGKMLTMKLCDSKQF